MSPRPRKDKLPENLYKERRGGVIHYRYKNPITGTKTRFGTDRVEAIKAARQANERLLGETDLVSRALGTARVTMNRAIAAFKDEYLPDRDLAAKTLLEYGRMLDAIERGMGRYLVGHVSVEQCAVFLDALPTVSSNRHRNVLVQVFKFCMAKGWIDWNPAEATLVKREVVLRQRLNLEQYAAIYAKASRPIRDAMDLSLVTLQARLEVSRMGRHDLTRGPQGERRLRVTRQKTAKHTPTAFLSIEVTSELAAIIDRCTTLECPYFVHSEPRRRPPGKDGKRRAPVQALSPEAISRGFQDARDATGLYEGVPPAERPTFHEVRSLGVDRYRKAGWDEADIQALLGHTSGAMTRHYMEGHEPAPVMVRAGLKP